MNTSLKMPSHIVVIGTGFSGVWSALSAKRLINLNGKQTDIEVTVIAPEPTLVIRPRLYEADASNMKHDLTPLFNDTGIKFVPGTVETIDTEGQKLHVKLAPGGASAINYDRLILAAGSNVVRPRKVAGLEKHAFDIDSIHSATKLEAHLKSLTTLPTSSARDTVIVCGAGFTGVELATELPKRFANLHVVLVEAADAVGPELGPGPRPAILAALEDLNVEVKVGSGVASIDAKGATLASGERIESMAVVWTAGVRATPLTQQIEGSKDALNRLHVDENLRVPLNPHVFATGDAACAVAHSSGQTALMSCQHALGLGRASGYNAAADLLGVPSFSYSHVAYICCLDLGSRGAVISGGYDRSKVRLTGSEAKNVKCYINQKLIYPPMGAEEALSMANPVGQDSEQLFDMMMAQAQAC